MESNNKGQPVEEAQASSDDQEKANGHSDKVQILKDNREQMLQGGGPKRIASQHDKGKLTARERVDRILDEGSFVEMNAYMQHRHTELGMADEHYFGDGLVAGFGKVNGRRICVYAQDFTVMGGSTGEVAGIKIAKLMDLAMQAGVPVIGINDGGGARIQEGVYSLAAYGDLFYRNTQASGVIPQISMIMGPCAGGAVYSPALTDFVIMTKGTSNMFITGPDVIRAVTGEEVDVETLGGASTHSSVSGVAHFVGDNEEESIALLKKLLEYIPSNNAESPRRIVSSDEAFRADASLNSLIPEDPNQTYDMHEVINRVVDLGSFFEVAANFAQNALIGFARLDGEPIGVVANQPAFMAGVLDINASDKIARFVRFCDAFNIPLVTFMDTPGFMPGTHQEHNGIIRHGAKIVYAFSEATVPKLTVITRKGYGGAYIVMSSKHVRSDFVIAWPAAEIAVMGADGAVNILYRREIKGAEDPKAERARLVAQYKEKFSNPYRAAEAGFVDEILVPSETRLRLIAALDLLRDKQVQSLPKKHGNMPL